MNEEIGGRIASSREIEALRGELRHAVLREESAPVERRVPSQIGWTGSSWSS